MNTLIRQLVTTFFIVAALYIISSAQSATATLSGSVTDEQGGVIKNAVVVLRDTAKSFERRTTSNEDGFYNFTQLPPSRYTIQVKSSGFATVEFADLKLNIGDQRSFQIQMKVGNVSETVTVEGNANSIQESAAVGTVIDRKFVENLPLNGRSFQSLILLTPGVVPTVSDTSTRRGQFSVNGQRDSSNYFTVDGVGANLGVSTGTGLNGGTGQFPAFNAQGGTNSLVSADALQEFKIQTSNFAPEFGRTPGGQVSIVTRSGTNQFHGTLFEYFRNEKLDANDWFANSIPLTPAQINQGLTKQPRAPLRNNQFGGVVGGPVFLPRFGEGTPHFYNGRKRTFFFFSYESLRLRLPQAVVNRTVPSLSARQQATGAIRNVFNAFPIPNGSDLGDGTALFSTTYSNPSSSDAISFRLDHSINDNLTIFGRYNYAPSENATRGAANGGASLRRTRYKIKTTTIGSTYIINSRTTNDLRVNFSTNRGQSINTSDNFGDATPLTQSSLIPNYTSLERTEFWVNLNGFGGEPYLGLGASGTNQQRQLNIVDTVSLTKGSHEIKVGVDYRRLTPVFNYAPHLLYYYFRNVQEAINNQSFGVYLGAVDSPLYPIFNNFSLYAQDTWRISPRLTLTYGARYEVNPPPTERNNKGIRAVSGLDNFANLALQPVGSPLWKTTYNNIAPRFGAAYQFSQKPGRETVLRGGIGMFYDITSGQASQAYDAFNYPYTADKIVGNFNLGGTDFVELPLIASELTSPPFTTERSVYSALSVFEPDLKLPYTIQWNATVEQSLGRNQTLSIAYVGNAGRRLYRSETYRTTANPAFRNLRVTRDDAYSNYHSLQLQFQRRLSKGFQALASYTLSKATDTLSSEGFITGNNPDVDLAAADFDRRHSFSSAVSYDIPSPIQNGFGNALLRDFSIDATFKAVSAAPIDVASLTNSLYTRVRPNLVPNVPIYIEDPNIPGGKRINRAAFVLPADETQGNVPRNFLRGFGFSQLDVALRRQFNFAESVNLQLRAEAFNLLNMPNFTDPRVSRVNSSNFGRSTSMLNRGLGGVNGIYQIGGPRSIQLVIRFQF